ncbi:MAG: InlB B-repeat-containing protein [Bacteroidales bacterium]|nr:InlB B-repeat-containing protein [Bacteroidales bacterium]
MKKILLYLALLLGTAIPTWAGNISGTITVQGGGQWPAGLWLALGKIDNSVIVGATDVSGGSYSFSVPYEMSVNFYLSTEGEWPTYAPSSDWVFVEGGQNPFTYDYTGGDVTLNLVIKPAGGGGDVTPKATLVGTANYEGNYSSCAYGITVAISGDDYAASTTTEYGDSYYDKVECSYGYQFNGLELGTYTLTYSKENFITQTQMVTIDKAEEIVVPPVTLVAKPVEYVFEGVVTYLNGEDEVVKVEGAKITAYDGDGEDAQVLGTTYTDAQGYWSMSLECAYRANIYFTAEHPNIVVDGRYAGTAVYQSGNYVTISCAEYTLPLLAPAAWKVKQVESGEGLRVEVSWTWPQELIDNYNTAPGEGSYRITEIKIFRPAKYEQNGVVLWTDLEVGRIQPAEYELPATSFLDGVESELVLNREFTYHMEISYGKPTIGNVPVPNDPLHTITLTAAPVNADSVVLTLHVNDPAMGTVTGAGKYEKNEMVVVSAQPKPGYRFVAWKEGDNTLATTASYTVTLTQSRELTAVFEAKPVVLDSVFLALDVNNPQWGSVQGAGKYAKGDDVTIKAVANSGYAFKQWKSGNTILSSKSQYTFVLNTDTTITAVFERAVQYRGMTNCTAKQTQGGANPAVRLSWQWPEELVQDYITAAGQGLYEISMVTVKRQEQDSWQAEDVGIVRPQANMIPPVVFTDNSANHPLIEGGTYTYFFEITYMQPAVKNITVKDDAHLTVTIASNPVTVEWVNLTLEADADKGTVTGGGQYEKNDSAMIVATPNAGYVFKAWTEGSDTVARTATCKIKVDRNRTLVALFMDAPVVVPDSVTLTLVADAEKGTVTGAGKYQKGQSVTITATAKNGYKFESWRENGAPVSTKASYTINSLVADRTLTAVFVASVDSVTLVLETDGNGMVQGAGKYALNEEVTIKATPNAGYVFIAWKSAQGVVSRLAEYTFAISQNLTLTAEFAVKQDSATLTLTPNDSEMGYVAGSGRYVKGTEVTITATPRAGHGFEAWKAGETVIATTRTHTLVLNNDSTLTAVFYAYPDSVNLTLLVNDTMMGTVQGAGRYPKNGTVTAKAIAKEGYAFKAWKANDVNVSKNAEYTFTLTENLMLTAEFEAVSVVGDSVTLTLHVGDARMGTVQGAGRYEKGAEVTIKAIANAGYEFVAWMNGGEIVTKNAEHKLVLNSDMTLTALFVEETANEGREQADWNVYVENQTIVLLGNTACQYEVYNMAGALVKQTKVAQGRNVISVSNSGLYIIRRISATGYSVKKVVVR